MKSKILQLAFLCSSTAMAQTETTIYAITDQVKGSGDWNSIRKIVSQSETDVLLTNRTAQGIVVASATGKKIADYNVANLQESPMFTGVAALAFDEKRNRLYFATMFGSQMRYINLGEGDKYYQVADLKQTFSTSGNDKPVDPNNQGGMITRMTIGTNGFGYALSNDGDRFFRFSLDKKGKIEVLGALLDAPENNTISVHNSCSSWGGDMVAAATGELYLFTLNKAVFKIDPETRIATYLGHLKGLPDNFTVNGAAVVENDQILLSAASISGTRALIFNLENLNTTLISREDFFNASDLATGKLLYENRKAKTPAIPLLLQENSSDLISIYPNPVSTGTALLTFNQVKTGRFTIDLLSASGNMVQRKAVNVTAVGQQVRLQTNNLAKGLYTVRVIDANSKTQFNRRMIVQ